MLCAGTVQWRPCLLKHRGHPPLAPLLTVDTVERWVSRTEGYSVAHLREVCIATQCFLQAEDDVFRRLDQMREINSFNDLTEDGEMREQAGFLGSMQAQQAGSVRKTGITRYG